MTKKIGAIFLIFMFIVIFAINNVLAYEDELFKFDLPSTYRNFSYNNQIFYFINTKDKNKGIMIWAVPDSSMKKSVWDIDEADVRKITNKLGSASTVSVDKKAKLGKEKALKYIFKEEGSYFETYIIASNKYVYIVAFTGATKSELSSNEYMTVKNSFKLKDSTTNWNVVRILVIIAIGSIGMIIRNKKRAYKINGPMNYGNIDYKNITEEDFNNLSNR